MKSSNNNEKKTKKVLCKEAKIYLLKAFLIPQVPMAFIFFLSLALLRVYLSKEYFVRPESKESTNEK